MSRAQPQGGSGSLTPTSGLEKPDSLDHKPLDDADAELKGGAPMVSVLTAGAQHYHNEEVDGPQTQEHLAETKRIMRKMDRRVLPMCSVLYLFSFLDRTAIGNAKVASMNAELHLSASDYAVALSVFFVPYALLEPAYTLAIKRWGARPVLSLSVIAWGIVICLTCLVQSGKGLIATRAFLGATESGLFPGIALLLSYLYPRTYISFRIGIFFSAATVAGAFGGLLSYALSHVRAGGYSGWRWLFIVLGLATIAVGIISFFFLISSVDEAKFLTGAEKEYLKDRLKYDGTDIPMNDEFQWKFVRDGLKDWKPYVSLATYIGIIAPVYATALCLPTILRVKLKYSAVDANLYTVPVYVVAAASVLISSWLSDYFKNRSYFIMFGSGLSAVGWGIGYASSDPKVRYAACFISALGSFAGATPVIAQLTQNVGGKTKRAVCVGIQGCIGGLAGIISSNIFIAKEAPNYDTAYIACLGLNCFCFSGAIVTMVALRFANIRKQRMIDSGEAAKLTRQQLADLGDWSPYFKYRW